ncbi:MAG: hypothetical protein ACP5VP_09265 [Candidatus Limnocylindrales bacterium]
MEVLDTLPAARAAWLAYQERVDELKQALRASDHPGLRFELARIEAYGALEGRDEGMGRSMEGWLDEIEQAAREAST